MSKKIIFMGTPEFSVKTLEVLAKSSYDISCVYTQEPKKSDRGQKINKNPIHLAAEKLNIKVRCPRNLDTDEEYKYFKSVSPFIVIVVAYGQIIPKIFLDLPEQGFLNIHSSLLPKLRGAAPIQRSIMNLEKETGISMMKIEEGLDTGPYMKQIKIKINDQTNCQELTNKLSNLGANNILNCLDLINENNAKFIRQNDSKASYARKITKLESKISWLDTAEKNIAKINGLNPQPGAWFEYEGSRFKIWKAKISNISGRPGEVIKENLILGCKEKSIEVIQIQKEGKKKLLTNDFIKGTLIKKGQIIN